MSAVQLYNEWMPRIGIQKITDTQEVKLGGTIKYTVHIQNKSGVRARNLIFHDQTSEYMDILPESIFINHDALPTSSMRDLFLGDLEKGQEMIIEFKGRVKASPACKYIANNAVVEYNYYQDNQYLKADERSNNVCVQLIRTWVD